MKYSDCVRSSECDIFLRARNSLIDACQLDDDSDLMRHCPEWMSEKEFNIFAYRNFMFCGAGYKQNIQKNAMSLKKMLAPQIVSFCVALSECFHAYSVCKRNGEKVVDSELVVCASLASDSINDSLFEKIDSMIISDLMNNAGTKSIDGDFEKVLSAIESKIGATPEDGFFFKVGKSGEDFSYKDFETKSFKGDSWNTDKELLGFKSHEGVGYLFSPFASISNLLLLLAELL